MGTLSRDDLPGRRGATELLGRCCQPLQQELLVLLIRPVAASIPIPQTSRLAQRPANARRSALEAATGKGRVWAPSPPLPLYEPQNGLSRPGHGPGGDAGRSVEIGALVGLVREQINICEYDNRRMVNPSDGKGKCDNSGLYYDTYNSADPMFCARHFYQIVANGDGKANYKLVDLAAEK